MLDVVPPAATMPGGAGRRRRRWEPTAPAWETEMLAVFDHHERRYGTQRLQAKLQEKSHRVGRQALRTGLR